MADVTITPTLLNEFLDFEPVKYFVSKHSIYPSKVTFKVNNRQDLFEKMKDKFLGFESFASYSRTPMGFNVDSFIMISEDKKNTIIFHYDSDTLYYYSKSIDEGIVEIIYTMVNHETEENY